MGHHKYEEERLVKNTLSKQRTYYNEKIAANFDKSRMNSNHLYKIETIESFFEKYIKRTQDLRVLEVGGGTGLHAEHFLDKENACVGDFILSDLSEDMLKVAKRRIGRYEDKVKFLSAPAETFQLDENVDCIYISGAMHHFSNPILAIQNCRKWTSEQGILIICEPVITNPYAWPRVIFKSEEWGQLIVTPKNIQKWLMTNGYEILEKRYLHYRSNHKCFRWITKLENIGLMNWAAVMFCIVARKA